MVRTIFLFTFSILFLTCKQISNKPTDSHPAASEVLSENEIEVFKYSIIRYIGKLPGKADHTTKFDSSFDEHYQNLAKQHDLDYYTRKGDTVFFLVSRIAPSLYEKKVAIGGKLVYDKEGNIVYYEEAFRTWRMLVPELKEKSLLLYDLYVKGQDLSPYYTVNSKGVEYIEFPDEHVRFDTELRRWVSDLPDPLEDYYDMKR